jgi:predicted nucleotidyltransferase
LREIAGATVHLPALEYHYDRMARRALADIVDSGAPRLKSYFYALRPAAAFQLHHGFRLGEDLAE